MTFYGRDNFIDGLFEISSEHENIRKELGVSVPVPARKRCARSDFPAFGCGAVTAARRTSLTGPFPNG